MSEIKTNKFHFEKSMRDFSTDELIEAARLQLNVEFDMDEVMDEIKKRISKSDYDYLCYSIQEING
jgi:hypothetical protein